MRHEKKLTIMENKSDDIEAAEIRLTKGATGQQGPLPSRKPWDGGIKKWEAIIEGCAESIHYYRSSREPRLS
jgi:hypothetical protein